MWVILEQTVRFWRTKLDNNCTEYLHSASCLMYQLHTLNIANK